jgi:hypothetical protein
MDNAEKGSSKIPLRKSLAIILVSIILSTSLGLGGYYFIKKIKSERFKDPRYNITAIAQNCSKGQNLKSGYFAEVLNLSIDKPSNLYAFDLKDAQKKLLASPLIQHVQLRKIPPNILFIEYETREPIAFLVDFKNTALDLQGNLFPFKPFFTPKKLPKIYVGVSDVNDSNYGLENGSGNWGDALKGHRIDMAFKIYKLLKQYDKSYDIELIKIDTSKAFSLSYGQREIIVILADRIRSDEQGNKLVEYSVALRLSIERYPQELANYLILRKELAKLKQTQQPSSSNSWTVIDLRLPDLAYIQCIMHKNHL